MQSVIYAGCHLCWVSFMLGVICAKHSNRNVLHSGLHFKAFPQTRFISRPVSLSILGLYFKVFPQTHLILKLIFKVFPQTRLNLKLIFKAFPQTDVLFWFQVRVMERRLNEVDWTPTELSKRAEEFQTGLLEKDRIIQTLETEVEQQVS
jgi:hypothetical protein